MEETLTYNIVSVYVYENDENIVTRFRHLPSLIYCVCVNENINAHRMYGKRSGGGCETIIISGKHNVLYIIFRVDEKTIHN